MIQITPQMRILKVAVESIDFRKGIGFVGRGLCPTKLDADPFPGYLFVFRSQTRATSIKVLVYDGRGFWLATKSACPKDASAGGPR